MSEDIEFSDQNSFDLDFQKTLIKLCCQNLKFYTQYGVMLEEDHFDANVLKLIFRLATKHLNMYESEINKNVLVRIVREYIDEHSLEPAMTKDLIDEVNFIFGSYISSEKYVTDLLVKFIRRQKMMSALNNSIDILSHNGEYEQVLKEVDEAVSFGGGADAGLNTDDIFNAPELYKDQYNSDNLVRTLIPSYDKALGGGGAPGETHLVLGSPKTGKSSFCSSLGSNFLLQGKTVFHVTLEISKLDVLIKYAARLSNLSFNELTTISKEEYKERLKKFERAKANLHIQHWPMNTINTLEIRSWISKIRADKGISPDVIIIDYDDLLNPIGKVEDDMYNNAGKVYSNLSSLAAYFAVPIWTCAQPKREAWSLADQGELIQAYHVAHSAKKIHACFSVSSLNFKSGSETGFLYVDLVRRGISNYKIPMKRDLSRSLFYELED